MKKLSYILMIATAVLLSVGVARAEVTHNTSPDGILTIEQDGESVTIDLTTAATAETQQGAPINLVYAPDPGAILSTLDSQCDAGKGILVLLHPENGIPVAKAPFDFSKKDGIAAMAAATCAAGKSVRARATKPTL